MLGAVKRPVKRVVRRVVRPQSVSVSRSSSPTNGFAVKPELSKIFERIVGGLPAGNAIGMIRPARFYHRLDIPVAGLAQADFFNVARRQGITNLDQPNTLPANYMFALSAMRFDFLYGIDGLGRRLGVASPTSTQILASCQNYGVKTTTAVDELAQIWKIAEKTREFLSQGCVQLRVAEKPIYEIYGLTSFPSGKGIVQGGGISNSQSGVTTQVDMCDALLAIANGAPVASNRFAFDTPFPIMAGQQFGVQVNWQTVVDWTEQYAGPLYNVTSAVTAGVLECVLEGVVVSPAN